MSHLYDSDLARSQDLTGAVKDTGIKSDRANPLRGMRQLGHGVKMFLELFVDVALQGSGDSCDVDLISDSAVNWPSITTLKQTLMQIPAEAGAGSRLFAEIPYAAVPAGDVVWGVNFVPRGSGNLTAGTVTVRCTLEPGRNVIMPRGETNVG